MTIYIYIQYTHVSIVILSLLPCDIPETAAAIDVIRVPEKILGNAAPGIRFTNVGSSGCLAMTSVLEVKVEGHFVVKISSKRGCPDMVLRIKGLLPCAIGGAKEPGMMHFPTK